jgi:oligoribonuclease
MIYCSIDIETTGLNPETCDILQFAAIIDDLKKPLPIDKLPKLMVYFKKNGPIQGEPYALGMHSEIFKKIAESRSMDSDTYEDGSKIMFIEDLPNALAFFLSSNGYDLNKSGRYSVTFAGKNIGQFDLPFLKSKIKNWGKIGISQRVLDPAILFLDCKNDTIPPDLKTCCERAGINDEVAHTAFEDALMVVKLMRHKFLGKI